MAKDRQDFHKKWEQVKKQLAEFGKEASVWAKKSEKELVRIGKQGKLRMDATTVGLKKEHVLYLIGKQYVQSGCPGEKNVKLQKLIKEFNDLVKREKLLNRAAKKAQKK